LARKEIQKMNYKSPFIRVLIHLSIVIAIAIITISIFFYIYLPVSTKHGESITVPDLQGMQLDEAEKFLEKRSLRIEVFDSSFVAGVKPMTILSQNPSAMANVKENRKIYISITPRLAPKIAFPDVIDYSAQMVQKILRNNGLVPGKITYRPDLAENAVLEAKINGAKITKGDSVYKGSTVDIVVGDGRGTTRFLMPLLKGLTMEEAEYTILGSGLVIGPTIYEESDTLEDGIIIKSLPSHNNGSIVRVGDQVKLWISGNNPHGDSLALDSIMNDIEIE
jgi:beta-lactam-binding protein with PASTA domain